MKEIVLDRLNKMEELEQRRLLKQLMNGVFLNLVEYQEEMQKKLEERVFSEIEDKEEKHDIYVTLCHRDDFDPIHEYLYPMIPGDEEKKLCDRKELAVKLSNQEEAVLMTIFLECDYERIQALMMSKRTFKGRLKTAGNHFPIEVRLQQSRLYMDELEKLYNMFQKNGMPWKTVNHPYASKFFDVILVACEGTFTEDEEILEMSITLDEWEPYKKLDVIPLWNIERLALKNIGFPVPAIDRVNFEHVLSLRKTGSEHGYLVDGDEELIRYIKRSPEELTVVSPQEKSGIWNVCKITKPVTTRIGRLDYELVSNRRKNSFVGSYARKQAITVRAKGEIIRIVHSFEAAEHLELVYAEIREKNNRPPATYGLNPFISDNVRVENDKKIMSLGFRRRGENSFILQDMMSFLVSEVQMYFPEYKCEGEWA
ncbi:normocyte-binding protein [Brevibacillus sp. 179-C9.3 HS]|uniref:normocyte-binding protein n=1 Tax=unclassified Brevibacillus TaxID=2684853 RepID=UPI0039A11C63